MELQMKMCNRLYDLDSDLIDSKSLNIGFAMMVFENKPVETVKETNSNEPLKETNFEDKKFTSFLTRIINGIRRMIKY